MLRRLLVAYALCMSLPAMADFLPCSPVFLADHQGRPIPNATASVVNLDGSAISDGVWLNSSGTMPFQGVLPSNQILQVFTSAGIYRVDVNGAGLSKTYQIICSAGLASSTKKITESREAQVLLLNGSAGNPTLMCSTAQPCFLMFDDMEDENVTFSFATPTYPITWDDLVINWRNFIGTTGNMVWLVNWCSSVEKELICDPANGGHSVQIVGPPESPVGGLRETTVPIGVDLPTNAIVYVSVEGNRTSLLDTMDEAAYLESVRTDFTRK